MPVVCCYHRWCARRQLHGAPRRWRIMALSHRWMTQFLSKHWGLAQKPPGGKQWLPHNYVTNKATAHAVSKSDGWDFQTFLSSSFIIYSSMTPLAINNKGSRRRKLAQNTVLACVTWQGSTEPYLHFTKLLFPAHHKLQVQGTRPCCSVFISEISGRLISCAAKSHNWFHGKIHIL